MIFATVASHDPLLSIRARDEGDNVEPASSSVAIWISSALGRFLDRGDFLAAAGTCLGRPPHGRELAPSPCGLRRGGMASLILPTDKSRRGRPVPHRDRHLACLAAERRVYRPS